MLRPRELVVPPGLDVATLLPEVAFAAIPVTVIDGWHFEPEAARRVLD